MDALLVTSVDASDGTMPDRAAVPVADHAMPVADHAVPEADHAVPVADHAVPVANHAVPVADPLSDWTCD